MSLKSYVYSIFYNLISNSIKYKKPDICPVIEIKSVRREDKIELLFKDNGRGIDLKKSGQHVFGLYKRFHWDVEGKGVGLFTVKTQVEALGGKISIKSEVNKGTEFKILFAIEKKHDN
jgi:signal transduction histidine kinase